MAKRGRPFKTITTTTNSAPMIIEASPVTTEPTLSYIVPTTFAVPAEITGVGIISQSLESLPAQPISRLRLLEVMKDQLKTPDGKAGMAVVIATKAYLNEMAEDVDDMTLQKAIFLHVKDGDERAIVRRFFSNLDE